MHVLFLGEGDLSGPARYLGAILTWANIPFDHRPDQARIPKAWRKPGRYDAIILSDYRYSGWTPCAREWLVKEVRENGVGLLMIGGWASFTGLVGGYAGTEIEELLPVTCVRGDDRVNCASGAVVGLTVNGKQLTVSSKQSRRDRLPFTVYASPPPTVCGYHRATPRPGSLVELELRDLTFGKTVRLGKPHPLLVTGVAGIGKTAAFLTDCAPHWAGGLVDWGRRRVTVTVNRHVTVEVGDAYLQFFSRLIRRLAAFPAGQNNA